MHDASAKEQSCQPSINECLNRGPPLQSLFWEILVRSRFRPILLTGDIEKAFLPVRIKAEERDALRFFWESPGSGKYNCVSIYSREVFEDATFKLHKWHSNDPTVENDNQSSPANEDEGSEKCDTKLLGLVWNKSEDTLSIVINLASEDYSNET